MYWIFLIPIILIFHRFRKFRLIDFYRPSILILLYTSVSLFLGIYVLEQDLLFYNRYNEVLVHDSYLSSLWIIWFLIITSLYVLPRKRIHLDYGRISRGLRFFLVGLVFLFILIPVNLPILGLQGSVSIYILLSLVPLILLSAVRKISFLSLATLIVLLSSQVFYENKREVFFLLIVVIGVAGFRFFTINYLHALVLLLFGIIMVLYLSLLRGYGGYNESGIDLLFRVKDYALDPDNIGYIITNFELESSSCNAVYSIEKVLDGSLEVTYGEGFLKPFTMFVPRSVWPGKPINYVSYYTSRVFPFLWASGTSLPVLAVSEFFGSFKWGAFVMFPLFMRYLDVVYIWFLTSKNIIRVAIGITMAATAIQYGRGSGLEMYFYPFVFAAPLYALLWKK